MKIASIIFTVASLCSSPLFAERFGWEFQTEYYSVDNATTVAATSMTSPNLLLLCRSDMQGMVVMAVTPIPFEKKHTQQYRIDLKNSFSISSYDEPIKGIVASELVYDQSAFRTLRFIVVLDQTSSYNLLSFLIDNPITVNINVPFIDIPFVAHAEWDSSEGYANKDMVEAMSKCISDQKSPQA